MRRKKAEEKRGQSLKTLFLFCLIVFLLVVVSLSVKAFAIIKASKFDGSHRFTLALRTQEKNKVDILSFDPKNEAISSLTVKGKIDNRKIGQALATFIDGEIVSRPEAEEQKIGKKLFSLAMRFDLAKTNITFLDLVRLSYFANGVADKNITTKEIMFPQSDTQIDRLSEDFFEDPDIVAESISLEVVNATGVSGFGRRLERMLTNLGSQVISISTARKDETMTKLQYAESKSYTVEKLERILGVTAEKQEGLSISDIRVILGKHSLSTKSF